MFLCVCLIENGFLKIILEILCVCLSLEKLVHKTHFPVKKKLAWFLENCFSFMLGEKHFSIVVKKLKISYYLLIILNLVLKLLIPIYIMF